jgi:hypothetical protein
MAASYNVYQHVSGRLMNRHSRLYQTHLPLSMTWWLCPRDVHAVACLELVDMYRRVVLEMCNCFKGLFFIALTALAVLNTGGFRPQFMPSIHGIAVLFSRFITAASLWVHLLAINLFAARSVLLEGTVLPSMHLLRVCGGTLLCACILIILIIINTCFQSEDPGVHLDHLKVTR